jgi:hypothetical protein
MKPRRLAAALPLLLALPVLAGRADAQVYVEGYAGMNFAASASNPFLVTPDPSWLVPSFTPSYPGRIDGAFRAGLKFGSWCGNQGFLGAHYPEWTKHVGAYVDFSVHSVNMGSQAGTKTLRWPQCPATYQFAADSKGRASTIAFMVAYRFGWPHDPEIPFGRLQPYVAAGPAIFLSRQQPSATSPPSGPDAKHDDFAADSSVSIALAGEGGVRWMARKSVSVDFSLMYRLARPTYNYAVTDDEGYTHHVKMTPTYHLFSVQGGVAYHFGKKPTGGGSRGPTR